ncbi:uncharacterized protein BJ171DRAFT_504868 [Polychytrium aggregatum]|uniref:uncharacterized protein n=1 Tax=Polychytrium aggregatum TaxID=110093 RepID=UPI0022FE4430|nr:uncharacterized protein BJ171DRAFT_504868 [Polychytrium aggregatum]KAI9204614.1 hypothetical protein BJ171DRAFT_504868 [Polychytrium aggregatum]
MHPGRHPRSASEISFEVPKRDSCVPADDRSEVFSPIHTFGIDYAAIEKCILDYCPTPPWTQMDHKASESTYCVPVDGDLALKKSPSWAGLKNRASRTSNAPKNRFTFYSETTNILKAGSFGALPLGQFGGSIKEFLSTKPFWLDICDVSDVEMDQLSQLFGIHPLTAEDILAQETLEKCDTFPNYYFVCIRTFSEDYSSPKFFKALNVYMVVFKNCVLSFHSLETSHHNNVLQRIAHLKAHQVTVSPDWINYGIIDDIIDSFSPLIEGIEDETEAIDDLVLILKASEQSDMLRRIGEARRKTLQVVKLLQSKADLLKALIKRASTVISADSSIVLYLGDIHDHIAAMQHNLSYHETTLSTCHSNYLAQISIEITQSANRTNDSTMNLTLLASILVPLNIITGLWGMNVRVPGGEEEGLTWFYGIVGSMVAIVLICFFVFRKLI